ncbi:MAG: CDP-glycerol glycerophosphotransferase family protein [Candidatus Saganbacteria bacterium]|nr:CDP-glycerol glycerophosphotransferase family protein [Candidatus Saganbacteria bacterium]
MSKIKTILSLIFYTMVCMVMFLAYFLLGLVPRRKDIVVFGSWEGKKFCDNAKYLFLYIAKNCKEYRPVWISRNNKIISDLRAQGFEAFHARSLKGSWFCWRAKFIFITHSLTYDVNPVVTRGAVILDLFHATLPIKKMGYDVTQECPLLKRAINFLSTPFEYIKADYAFSPSKNISPILSTALRVKTANIKVTGLPRSDYMLQVNDQESNKDYYKIFKGRKFKNMIYYIPTFRSRKEFDLFHYGFSEAQINDLLEKTDSVLLIRFHPFDSDKYKDIAQNKERIFFDNTDDLYPLLKKADILITDYSSICFDYLLMDKPIVFANFDYADYLKERPLYCDYAKITPGVKAENWPDLVKSLELILISGQDQFIKEREIMKQYVYDYLDQNACARIARFFRSLQGEQ